jgi:fructose-1,6-bisphosphatase II
MEMRIVSGQSFRNLGLELARATESAALAAGQWMGRGKPDEADSRAREAMSAVLAEIEVDGRIVFREEGRLPDGDLLSDDERTGTGAGPRVDFVVDSIDGCNLLARGSPGAISVAAAAPSGSFWTPKPARYMDKLIVDAEVASLLVPECLDAPAAWTLALVARAKKKRIGDLVAFVLDRPRHAALIEEIRTAGARVMLRSEGDVAGALMAVFPDGGVDVLMGTGGITEGLLAACAVKAAGGGILGRLAPQSEEERTASLAAGLDLGQILTADELVQGNEFVFAATGITDGPVLRGVQYRGGRAVSNSMILRGETHTRRTVHAEHWLDV